jgi:hypothetical protein
MKRLRNLLRNLLPYRCQAKPLADPLCTRARPCMACWRVRVAALQAGMNRPKLTAPRIGTELIAAQLQGAAKRTKTRKPVLMKPRRIA